MAEHNGYNLIGSYGKPGPAHLKKTAEIIVRQPDGSGWVEHKRFRFARASRTDFIAKLAAAVDFIDNFLPPLTSSPK